MRVWPVVLGCAMIAIGLYAWLGASLTASAGFAGTDGAALQDAFFGLPGLLMVGGVALLLFGFTRPDERRR